MGQDDPAVSVMLDEWHRQCHLDSTELDAMTAVLAAYRRHVLSHRPDAERLAEIAEWSRPGHMPTRDDVHFLFAALADATARAEAAEDALTDLSETEGVLWTRIHEAEAETARLGRDWGYRTEEIIAERDAAVADADTQRAAADEWQSRYEELLAERGVER